MVPSWNTTAVHDFVSRFFSQLHRVFLKRRGYNKIRHSFSREINGYTERVQYQGSVRNGAHGPWTFYINFGVEFPDFEARTLRRDFPFTHCGTRIEHLVDDVSRQHAIGSSGSASLAEDSLIVPVSRACSSYL